MKQKLIVEGHNDILVISHLLLSKNIKIRGYEEKQRYEKELVSIGNSKRGALNALKVALKTEEIERIGLIIDADSNTTNPALDTWRSVRGCLQQNGYQNLPNEPNPNGTIVQEEGKSQVGVWIMPDNTHEGYLEHFFERLIETEDELLLEATQVTERLVAERRNRFSPIHLQKAKIRTWLVWQNDPESPMGLALRDYPPLGFMNLETPFLEQFFNWLRQSFDTIER